MSTMEPFIEVFGLILIWSVGRIVLNYLERRSRLQK